jgi:hypothetical protein
MKILKSKAFLLVIALLVCCPSSLGQHSTSHLDIPKGWKMVKAEGRFTIHLPPGAWDTGFRALDEFYREWRIGPMRFMLIDEPMGFLSFDRREQVFGKGYRESVIEVDGRKAYLCDYTHKEKGRRRYYTDLFVGDWPNGDVKLEMRANSARAADLEIAKKIFRTVEFLGP